MNLTYEIVKDELSELLDCEVLGSKSFAQKYFSCAVYESGMPVENNYIYLCSGVPYALADKGAQSLFIICDESLNAASKSIMGHSNYLGFSEIQPLSKITGLIFNIFAKLNHWYEQLNVEIGKPGFIDNLLVLTYPLLENTIILVDNNLRPISKYDSEKGLIDITTLEAGDDFLIQAREEYLKTRSSKEVIYGQLKGDYPRLVYNLFDGDSLLGIISIQGDARPIRPSDSDILKVLGDYIAVIFQHLGSKYMPHITQLCAAISMIIQNDNASQMHRNAVNHFSKISGIDNEEEFQVLVINGSDDYNDRYLSYFMYSISTKIPGLVVTGEDSNIAVFIIRTSYAQSLGLDVQTLLQDYLKEYNFFAAISDLYQDLKTTRAYYLQARITLELALESGSPAFLNSFSDHYVNYLLSRMTMDIPAQNLYSASFRKILQLDRESKISYIETLRAYMLNHLSSTKTANALYISRNAFMYRLEKILSILESCGEDLSDRDDNFRIQISFFLYDHFGFKP